MNVSGVILAAGKGTRMKSNLPKVLHSVSGKKLISYALEVIEDINTKYVVVGHEAEQVMEALPESLNFVIQEEQKGTGHAISILLEDKKFANDTSEYILVLILIVYCVVVPSVDLTITFVREPALTQPVSVSNHSVIVRGLLIPRH